jgi:hypothetical protein
MDEATIDKAALNEFKQHWAVPAIRLCMIPGKEALSKFNERLQARYGVSLTPTVIVEAMNSAEVPEDMRRLIETIAHFASTDVR